MLVAEKYDISNNIIDVDIEDEASVLAALDILIEKIATYDALKLVTIKPPLEEPNIDPSDSPRQQKRAMSRALKEQADNSYLTFFFRNPQTGDFYDQKVGRIPYYYQKDWELDPKHLAGNEPWFWTEIQRYPAALPKWRQYVERVVTYCRQSRIHKADQPFEREFGFYAAQYLAVADNDAVPLYGQYLQFTGTHLGSGTDYLYLEKITTQHKMSKNVLAIWFSGILKSTEYYASGIYHTLSENADYKNLLASSSDEWFQALDSALQSTGLLRNAERLEEALSWILEPMLKDCPHMREAFEERAEKYPYVIKWLKLQDVRNSAPMLPHQIPVDSKCADKAKMEKALDRMIAIMKSNAAIEAALAEGSGELSWEFGSGGNKNKFKPYKDGRREEFEEKFFSKAVKQKDLIPKVEQYAKQVTKYLETSGHLYTNCEQYAGTWAWVSLALEDKAYIDQYTRFLRSNDLGHEVHQGSHIHLLIKKHKWCEETLTLLAARMTMDGQHAGEDLDMFEEKYKLSKHFDKHPEHLELFCVEMLRSQEHHYQDYGRSDFDEYIWSTIWSDEKKQTAAKELMESIRGRSVERPADLELDYDDIVVDDPNVEGPDKPIVLVEEAPQLTEEEQAEEKVRWDRVLADALRFDLESPRWVRNLAIDRKRGHVFVNGQTKDLTRFGIDLNTCQPLDVPFDYEQSASRIAVGAGVMVLSLEKKGDETEPLLHILDLETQALKHVLPMDASSNSLCIDEHNGLVAIALKGHFSDNADTAEGRIDIVDLTSGKVIKSLMETGRRSEDFECVAFTPDGQQLVAADREKTCIWRTEDWALLNKAKCKANNIVMKSEGAHYFVVGQKRASLYRVSDAAAVHHCQIPREVYYQSACIIEDKYLVAGDWIEGFGGGDGYIDIYSVEDGKCLASIVVATDAVWDLCYDPERRLLITGSRDAHAKVWDWSTIETGLTGTYQTEQEQVASASDVAQLLQNKQFDEVAAYMAAGVDIHKPVADGESSAWTLLFLHNDAVSVIKSAIETLSPHGLDLNALDPKLGFNVLHYACSRLDSSLVEMLCDYDFDFELFGENANSYPKMGKATPLNLALANSQGGAGSFGTDVARILLEHGADPNGGGVDGRTALCHATCVGIHDAMEVLIEAGADVDKPSNTGRTPLGIALSWDEYPVEKRESPTVDVLLKYGVDKRGTGEYGQTVAEEVLGTLASASQMNVSTDIEKVAWLAEKIMPKKEVAIVKRFAEKAKAVGYSLEPAEWQDAADAGMKAVELAQNSWEVALFASNALNAAGRYQDALTVIQPMYERAVSLNKTESGGTGGPDDYLLPLMNAWNGLGAYQDSIDTCLALPQALEEESCSRVLEHLLAAYYGAGLYEEGLNCLKPRLGKGYFGYQVMALAWAANFAFVSDSHKDALGYLEQLAKEILSIAKTKSLAEVDLEKVHPQIADMYRRGLGLVWTLLPDSLRTNKDVLSAIPEQARIVYAIGLASSGQKSQKKPAKKKNAASKKATTKKRSVAKKSSSKTSVTKKKKVAKKAASKNQAGKKPAKKKVSAKKKATVQKKQAPKKPAAQKKKATKKSSAKKQAAKKAVSKKAVAKKTVAKKIAEKKAVTQKKPAKKKTTKKKAVKKSVTKKRSPKK